MRSDLDPVPLAGHRNCHSAIANVFLPQASFLHCISDLNKGESRVDYGTGWLPRRSKASPRLETFRP